MRSRLKTRLGLLLAGTVGLGCACGGPDPTAPQPKVDTTGVPDITKLDPKSVNMENPYNKQDTPAKKK